MSRKPYRSHKKQEIIKRLLMTTGFNHHEMTDAPKYSWLRHDGYWKKADSLTESCALSQNVLFFVIKLSWLAKHQLLSNCN